MTRVVRQQVPVLRAFSCSGYAFHSLARHVPTGYLITARNLTISNRELNTGRETIPQGWDVFFITHDGQGSVIMRGQSSAQEAAEAIDTLATLYQEEDPHVLECPDDLNGCGTS